MKVTYLTATIANAGTVSSAIDVGGVSEDGCGIVAIYLPASFEGTALTFQGSYNGSTFKEVITTAGTALTYTVAADKWLTLPVADLAGFHQVKIVSGTAMGAERTLRVAIRKVA